MNKKKILTLVIMLSIGMVMFSGCVGNQTNSPNTANNIPGNNQQITKPASSNENPSNVQVNKVPVNNPNSQVNNVQINLEDYSDSKGIISMKKPAGWSVYTTGQCGSLGVLVRDDSLPENQIFTFIDLHPFYLSEEGKQKWINYYKSSGAYPPPYIDMPAIQPFTPENFLMKFGEAAQTNYEKNYLAQMPVFENVYVVSSKPVPGYNAKTMRAVFAQNGKVTEGLFFVMLVPGILELGDAYLFTGISSDKNNFQYMEKKLLASLGSISINPQYVASCQAQNEKISSDISGYSETSNEMQQTNDATTDAQLIMADKYDYEVLRGQEIEKDQNTGETFTEEHDWYQNVYSKNPQSYNRNVQPLSDTDPAWHQIPYDGPQNIYQQ